jgi:hypothetical protein
LVSRVKVSALVPNVESTGSLPFSERISACYHSYHSYNASISSQTHVGIADRLKSYPVTDFPLDAVVQARIRVEMLDINRLATEAAEESEITWKEAEARAIEPTKKILELLDLELLDLIIPPNHRPPPSLQSTERSKLDLTEHMRSKGEQLSSQLLSGIIDKFPEGLDILSEASTRSHVEAAVYVNDPLLGVFREAFTAVTGNKDFVNPVSASTSATSIFLSYPPASKKTLVVDPNSVPDSYSVPSITELDGWTSRLLKKQKWARTYIADVWPVLMKIPYGEPSATTYVRHTFGANGKVRSKVRSIIGQAILFRYTGTSAPGQNARQANR